MSALLIVTLCRESADDSVQGSTPHGDVLLGDRDRATESDLYQEGPVTASQQ